MLGKETIDSYNQSENRFLASMRRRKKLVETQDEVFDLYDIDLSDEDAAAF